MVDIPIVVPTAVRESASDVSLDTIPTLTIATGITIDMSVYINGTIGSITNSQIIGLDTDLATYSHATKLITGVSTGSTMTGLEYELTI